MGKLVSELKQLELTDGARQTKRSVLQRWIGRLSHPEVMVFGTIPLCWAGYCISSAVCDAPEPFLLLRMILDVNAVFT